MSPFIVSKSEGLTAGNENDPAIFSSTTFIISQPEPSRLAQVPLFKSFCQG